MKKLFLGSLLAALMVCAPSAHAFKVGGMTWVTTDGTANQCMKTDGAGNLGWRSVIGLTGLSATSPVLYDNTTGIFSMHVADSTHSGYLLTGDWINFNNRITGLTGDVTATGPTGGTGPENVAATVATVGGSTAANIHAAELLANAATSANTASTIVKRTSGGDFTANQANLSALGVGTTSPSSTVEVVGATHDTGYGTGAYGEFIARAARGSIGSPSAVQSGDEISNFGSRAYGTSAFSSASKAAMRSYAAQTWTDAHQGTYTTFETTPNNSTTPVVAMRINNDGYVSIGNTNDTYPLDVTGSVNATTFIGALTGTASGNLQATANNHGVIVSGSSNTATVIAPDSSTTKVLTSGGSSADPVWATVAADLGFTTLGDTLYGGASGVATRLAGNTTSTKKFLRQTGTGSVSAAPTWDTLVAGDVPTLNQDTTGTAAIATTVSTTSVSNSATYYPLMAASSSNSNQAQDLSTKLTFNPSSGLMGITGSLGIGATDPTIYPTSSTLLAVVSSTANTNIAIASYGTAPSPALRGFSANGTSGSPTASQSGDDLLVLGGHGYGSTGFSSASKANMHFIASQAWTDAHQGAYTVFNVTPNNSTTIAEAMRINQDGKVSIGGTADTYNLDVTGTANVSTNETIGGTLNVTGVTTLTAQPIVSSLTASLPVFTDSSKGLISGTQTGTGTVVVVNTSPTLVTPTLGVAQATSIAMNNTSAQMAIGGTLSSSAKLIVKGTDAAITGGSVTGIQSSWTANSNNTSNVIGFEAGVTTAASTTVVRTVGFESDDPTKGSGGTLTNHVDFYCAGAGDHIATNNACISDSGTPGGNFFIKQSGTDASTLGGTLNGVAINASGAITSSVAAGAGIIESSSSTGTNSIKVANTNSTAGAASQYIMSNDSSHNFRIQMYSSGGTNGANLTGGLTGEITQMFTDYAGGLSIGANNIAGINISTTGGVTLPNGSKSGDDISFSSFTDDTNRLYWLNGATREAQIGVVTTSGGIITGAGVNDLAIRTNSTHFRVSTDNGGTSTWDVASTGATTFATLAGTGSRAVLADANGTISAPVSDMRLKKDVVPLVSQLDPIRALKALRGVFFHWDTSKERVKNHGSQQEIGMIAQEVEKIVPQAVTEDKDGWKSLDYSHLVPLLIETAKKQQSQLENQEKQINELRAQLRAR